MVGSKVIKSIFLIWCRKTPQTIIKMEGILLIDKEKKMQWNKLSSDLNNKLYFIQKHQNDDDERTVEYLKTHCTIEKLVEISQKMNEIEKTWYRGEIIV